ncbi:hypothetical protein FRC03_010960 [Tulasnella sp. 419]|nr:hypothetical protein FRC03_010960 [Tulasnella sp. 419]
MMLGTFTAVTCLLLAQIANVKAAVPLYGYCYGKGYTGPGDCEPPNICLVWNDYDAQCMPPNYSGTPIPVSTYIPTTMTTTRPASSTSATKFTTSTSAGITRTFSWSPTGTSLLPPCTPTPIYVISTAYIKASNSLYISQLPGGAAGLSKSNSVGQIQYSTASTGSYIRTSCVSPLYLSVYELYPAASYKPLVWTSSLHTDYWVVPGKISTTSSSPYGSKSIFWACGVNQQLFLQTGPDAPLASMGCKSVTLNLVVSIW